ncbi:hypothetical protein GGR50DRAFT_212016 [Xylaria sp. CBS 124048]|nr:hypothetical protein GGR50DRAFT_212016 [Xylaria sp. CBS 124048]
MRCDALSLPIHFTFSFFLSSFLLFFFSFLFFSSFSFFFFSSFLFSCSVFPVFRSRHNIERLPPIGDSRTSLSLIRTIHTIR